MYVWVEWEYIWLNGTIRFGCNRKRLRYTVGYSRVILLAWPNMLTCVCTHWGHCAFIFDIWIHTHTHIEQRKKPTQHTHSETESQRFLSLFNLYNFIHSLFLTFSLSLCMYCCCWLLFVDRCWLLLVLPPRTLNWYHCASSDLTCYKALARVMELANSLNPTKVH